MKNSTIFGPYLRNLRKQKHVSLRSLSAQVGIDFTYISKIELGHSAAPSEEVIRRIARVLDIDGDDLINHAGKVPVHLKDVLLDNPLLSELLRVLSERRLPDEVYGKMLMLAQEEHNRTLLGA